jgi:hypothetical protein
VSLPCLKAHQLRNTVGKRKEKGGVGLFHVANSNTICGDNEELIELVSIMGKDKGEPVSLQFQGCIRAKPQEDHASMGTG